MKKVYLTLEVKMIILIDEDTTVDDVISNMDYNFDASDLDNATITDTEIMGYEIIDSK